VDELISAVTRRRVMREDAPAANRPLTWPGSWVAAAGEPASSA